MFCVIPLLLVVSNALALPAEKPYYDLAEAEIHFSDFIQKYEKKYESYEEHKKRFEIFKNRLEKINHLNEIQEAVFAVNNFSDLSQEEFSSTHLGALPPRAINTTDNITVKKEWILNAPDDLDYRDQNLVTPVKDQANCGSCYVFSAIGNIEGQNAKIHQQLVSQSVQQGVDCGTDHGCHGGWPVHVMNALVQNGGSEPEEDYPYEGQDGTCRTDTSKITVKVMGGQEINTPTEEELKGAIAQYGPLSVCLQMPNDNMNYHGGVWSPPDCAGGSVDHCVLAVGYGTDAESGKKYFLIKNSYGSVWGEQGYFRLESGFCQLGSYGTATAQIG